MSGLLDSAKPDGIKASHRRRRKIASGRRRQRYYDPTIGRFLSTDPMQANANTGASFNRYAYAANNPYKFTDPDGRQEAADRFGDQFKKDAENGNSKVYEPFVKPAAVVTIGMVLGPFAAPVYERLLVQAGLNYGRVALAGEVAAGAAGVTGTAGVANLAGKEAAVAKDFFAGTSYTSKVLGQMKQGDYHAFPESVKAFQGAGQVSKITGGDGVTREMLRIPGSYRGKEGAFEFIKDARGVINHRLFKPDKEQ